MTGYITGTLADPDGADELLRTAEQSLKVAEQLDCPRLNVHGTGLDDQGLPVVPTEVVTPAMWLTAVKTLTRLAELGERAGRVFTLENLNTAVDHPGTPFAKAADTLALVEAVDSPHLQAEPRPLPRPDRRGEPRRSWSSARCRSIGEIQVADVPGRCEPGTGEIHYPAVAAALHRLGYDGVVGLEGWASGDPGAGARPLPRRLHRVPLSSSAVCPVVEQPDSRRSIRNIGSNASQARRNLTRTPSTSGSHCKGRTGK